MSRRALATAVGHSYPWTESHCVAPSLLSRRQFVQRSTPATHLPLAGEGHHLQAMFLEATDLGSLFTPRTDEQARTISLPLAAGSEAAPASPIMAPPCSGELPPPRPSSDAAIRRQARQAAYEFSRGDEDLEIMYELNSDMGITLRHPKKDALARAEEAPLGGEMVDSSTGEPPGGDDWTGLDVGQAPIFWHGGDSHLASSDLSGGDAVRTVELLGARLQKDTRQQLELTESCARFGLHR